MWGAVELETLSKQYYLSREQKKLVILSNKEIRKVVRKFANYGPKSKTNGIQSVQSSNGHANENYPNPPITQPNIKLPVVKF